MYLNCNHSLFKTSRHYRGAFTLIELLLVIAVLTILFAATLVAINPAAQFRKANDATRLAHTREIQKSINQYVIENNAVPPSSVNGTPMPSGAPGFEIAKADLDICSKLIPQYLAQLPVDPTLGAQPVVDCNSAYRTNYKAYYNSSTRAYVLSSVDPNYNYPAGMVGYWRLDESSWIGDCSSPVVNDSSGNGNTGKACPNGSAPVITTSGQFSNAATFNGVNQIVTVPDNPTLVFAPTDSMTLAGWMKTANPNVHILAKHTAVVGDGYELALEFGYVVATAMDDNYYGASGFQSVTGGLNDDKWHHAAYTYNATTGISKIYIDGALNNTRTESPKATDPIGTGGDFYIAGDTYNNYMQGSIDDVQVYKRDLSAAEIQQIFLHKPW